MNSHRMKRLFRERALVERLAVADEVRQSAGHAAAGRVLKLLVDRNIIEPATPSCSAPSGTLEASFKANESLTVLTYATHGHEFPAEPVLDALADALGANLRVVYPRVSGPTTLSLHECGAAQLVAGYRNILEPPADAPAVDAGAIDLVLIPGVAFDERAMRLGYGKGFYDRALGEMSGALKVGLSFDETLYPAVPCEPHDFPLDAVVTPTRTVVAEPR